MSGGDVREAPPRPRLRPPVAILLSRFPRVTETFILREVVELERQGQPVVLVPLIRERPPLVHPEARPWMRRALFTPWLSPGIARSNLRAIRRRPGAWAGALLRLVAGMLRSPGFLARTLALYPKAVHLAERLSAEGVTHVHAHFATHPATVAWVVERLAGIPYSVTVHAHDVFVDRTFLGAKLRQARFVRAISRFNRSFLADRYPEAAGRLEVVHVGVEPARYAGAAPSAAAGPSVPDRTRLLTVAALEPYKGIDRLIEAAAILRERFAGSGGPRLEWEVVGEGRLRPRLEESVARRGLAGTVRLVGALPQEEVARRLGGADIVVQPSVVAPDGQMEGIPVALMEALAAGRPVVASSLSGIPELVEDGVTGLLVPPGDAQAMAAAVERLVGDAELAVRLAGEGRARVEAEFRLGTTVAELLALVDRETGAPGLEADRIGPALAAAGLGGRPAGMRRLRVSPDSRVAEVLVGAAVPGGEPLEVVVKRHRARPGESAPPAERARRELELLARFHAAGGGGPYGVPRPRVGTPAGDGGTAVVVERAGGERLDALIRRLRLRPGPGSRRTLEDAFRRAGGWLRWFRGVAGDGWRHGDFWPGNVFVAPDRVEVIDLEGARRGPGAAEDDAAYFLRHARLYFRLPGLGRRFRRLERAFLEGLGGAGEEAP